MLGGVDLPDLVGLPGPLVGGAAPRRPAGRRRRQARAGQPAADGARGGHVAAGVVVPQRQPDQVGAPAGVPAAQLGGGRHQVGGRRGPGPAAVAVVGGHAVLAVGGEAPAQAADGARAEAQGGGDGRRRLALLPAAEHGTAGGDGQSGGHGAASQGRAKWAPLLYAGGAGASKLCWPDFPGQTSRPHFSGLTWRPATLRSAPATHGQALPFVEFGFRSIRNTRGGS